MYSTVDEMSRLTLDNVLPALAQSISGTLALQIADPQRSDYGGHDYGGHDYGGVVQPEWGLAAAGSTAAFVAGCGFLYLAHIRHPCHKLDLDPAELLAGARRAAEYLLRVQRPSGLIDLRDCNYDSSPDTGFVVQALCTLIELGRPATQSDPNLAALLDQIEPFVRRAVPGMCTGGFHTPNHRWVIASALAQAGQLYPDLDFKPTLEAYLAEGFDLDVEGAYNERSSGIYDAVTDRSLLLIADNWNCPTARPTVKANLEFNLYLLHADGATETGLSRRQDYGVAPVPLSLASCYLYSAAVEPNPVFARAAQTLWENARAPNLGELNWLAYTLLKFGDPAPSSASLPQDYCRWLPHNGLWRVRRGPLSASFFRGGTRLFTLRFGQAELGSVKISANYFGTACGWFIGDSLDVHDDAGVFRSEGLGRPRRPGYELPLGRPVPPERYEAMVAERSLRTAPPLTSALTVQEVVGGFDLRYQTLDGLDGVTAQIAFDFAPGGVWETADACFKPQAGQVIFLKRGDGAMRYGSDVIQIGPGADAHRMWAMRDAEPAPGHTRVLMTFVAPIDHRFSIRAWHGLAPPNDETPRCISRSV